MRRLIQHQPRRANRIPKPLHASHTACPQILPVHQQSIHLHTPILRQKRAPPRVEGLIVLHDGNRSFNSIHSTSSSFEKRISGSQGIGDAIFVGGNSVVGHGPGAAVN
jgi:hypothetical protein